ncbi:uncharacterized protein HMPREF1120_07533 [Exophiala dermatitidis NIH/UT8656]|uniref:Uncharacterized protein n=1 Tax=Exophiala dermatitidis (strain ATCC 34100 / CBS 525.76 / NIH/UT8656) TaxID=858893 RepID=H6C749_EXODN|nr:uncharacterized protein HMPREF1120_07533 [Exophiala dermatitidis NIH/UT8656]EHY59545.1 hypothetical protein HMPREF1120_07533 [Exophiala dermatitidis NIH/UT8656]
MGASKASSSAAAAAQFATLAPRIKNISEATIRKKWKPLPAGSQDKVRQILFNLKTKRAGASSSRRIATVGSMRQARAKRPGSNTQVREEEYEKAVEEVADRLLSRLPRMPFPPTGASSKADESPFDLFAALHRISALQAQLTVNRQSAHLLRMQIRREQQALRRDKAELAGLQDAVKRSQRLRRKRETGLHPLARTAKQGHDHDEIERPNSVTGIAVRGATSTGPDYDVGVSTSASGSALTIDEEDEPELGPLLKQLRSHLHSMRNNTASLNPVLAAMDEAKCALDRFAVTSFDRETLMRLSGIVS